jgi:hypothetical protein
MSFLVAGEPQNQRSGPETWSLIAQGQGHPVVNDRGAAPASGAPREFASDILTLTLTRWPGMRMRC